jgi:hypothetical protein
MLNKMKITIHMKIKLASLLMLILIQSCNNSGFFVPFSTNLGVPMGPPEFQAGWRDGCSSALNQSVFMNAKMEGQMSYGTGIYQHDPMYQNAWAKAWFACATQAADFVNHTSTNAPLE